MRKSSSSDAVTTFLGAEASIEGTINFEGTIRVDGRVSGTIRSVSGTLIVGEKAVIDGDVFVGVAVVLGKVSGMIEAASRIEVYPPANIEGNIQSPVISIDAGVVFQGNCSMPSRNRTSEVPERVSTGESGGDSAKDKKNSKKLLTFD